MGGLIVCLFSLVLVDGGLFGGRWGCGLGMGMGVGFGGGVG